MPAETDCMVSQQSMTTDGHTLEMMVPHVYSQYTMGRQICCYRYAVGNVKSEEPKLGVHSSLKLYPCGTHTSLPEVPDSIISQHAHLPDQKIDIVFKHVMKLFQGFPVAL